MSLRNVTSRQWYRPWLDRIPRPVRTRVRHALERVPLVRRLVPADLRHFPPGTVDWGSLRRLGPFSRNWGFDRGTPVDRIYIESFLAAHAADIRGTCLEVMNSAYTDRFGGGRVSCRDVLDIDPANTGATVIADIGVPQSLPPSRYDCVIFTQTLHLIPDMRIALDNVWRALVPGGVLLVTASTLGKHDPRKGFHHDRWRITKTGLEWLLAGLEQATFEVTTYGNLVACAAYLYGLAAEELQPDELHTNDPAFPMIVTSRVRKGVVQ
jgi:Methyltransferase domain